MQDRHVTYRKIEAFLGISSTSIHSILHDHLVEKKISSGWISYYLTNAQKRLLSIGVKKCWKNTAAVFQKTFIRSSEVTNHESMRMNPKQNDSPTCGSSKTSQIQRKLFVEEQLRSRWTTVPRDYYRTVNSEWHTAISFSNVFGEIRKTNNRRRIIVHQCERSLIGSNQRIFDRSKRRMDRSSGVQPWLGTQWLLSIPTHRKKRVINDFRRQNMLLKRSKTMFWKCLNRSGKSASTNIRIFCIFCFTSFCGHCLWRFVVCLTIFSRGFYLWICGIYYMLFS